MKRQPAGPKNPSERLGLFHMSTVMSMVSEYLNVLRTIPASMCQLMQALLDGVLDDIYQVLDLSHNSHENVVSEVITSTPYIDTVP